MWSQLRQRWVAVVPLKRTLERFSAEIRDVTLYTERELRLVDRQDDVPFLAGVCFSLSSSRETLLFVLLLVRHRPFSTL